MRSGSRFCAGAAACAAASLALASRSPRRRVGLQASGRSDRFLNGRRSMRSGSYEHRRVGLVGGRPRHGSRLAFAPSMTDCPLTDTFTSRSGIGDRELKCRRFFSSATFTDRRARVDGAVTTTHLRRWRLELRGDLCVACALQSRSSPAASLRPCTSVLEFRRALSGARAFACLRLHLARPPQLARARAFAVPP